MIFKKCKECQCTFHVGEFFVKQILSDGRVKYRSRCKPCYRAHERKTAGKRFIKYKANNPDKVKSQVALRYAVKAGKIIKPKFCNDCQREFPLHQIHGHHEDYSKALEVKWLCIKCHTRIHRGGYSKL